MSGHVWVNGIAEADISAFDRGLAYGDGLFATMRFTKNERYSKQGILFLDAHLARLTQSAARLGFSWQPSQELLSLIEQVGQAYIAEQSNQKTRCDACIKLLLTRGVGGRGYQPANDVQVTEVLSVHDIPAHYSQWQVNGISLQTSLVKLSRQPRLAGMKHLNRLEQVLIRSGELEQGFDDWLVLDAEDNVIESSMANIFFIQGHSVVTPCLSHSGVAGVMREQLIYWFTQSGFNLDCRELHHDELAQFDHAIIANSLFGVVGINRIDEYYFDASELPQRILTELNLSL